MVKAPKGYYTVLDFMTMTEGERMNALRDYRNMLELGVDFVRDPVTTSKKVKSRARRKKSKYSKLLSAELKAVRKQATLKSGKLRKGMTPAKILQKAHKNVKRRLK